MWLLVQQDRGAAFLYACICGLVIGILYDMFRIARVVYMGGRVKLFFEDLLFCVAAAVVFVVYSYNAAMGSIRLYAAMGALFGFFVYRFTIGIFTVRAARFFKSLVTPPLNRFKAYVKHKITSASNRWYTFRCVRRAKGVAAGGFKV